MKLNLSRHRWRTVGNGMPLYQFSNIDAAMDSIRFHGKFAAASIIDTVTEIRYGADGTPV